MTAVAGAVTTVRVVRQVRAFPWLRTILVIALALFILWRYFVYPAIDRLTPWEGIEPNPSMPNIPGTPWPVLPDPPWDGVIPGSCGTAPTPVEPAPMGFTAMWHDLGKGLRALAEGPPTPEQMVGWFHSTGKATAQAASAVQAGLHAQPLPLAPLPAPPTALPVAACGPGEPRTLDATLQGESGRLPDSALVQVQSGRLRADVAPHFTAMAAAFEADLGKPLILTSGYRSYEQQAALKLKKPRLAAPAGKSNHGHGVAVDLGSGVQSFGTTAHRWMQMRGAEFGFVHPSWARQGGSKPEPWHWEFVGAGTAAG